MTRTLVVSDLHLGTRAGSDVLRRDGILEALLGALEGIDRLILLGDILELRQGDARAVLARSRTVLERRGERLGDRVGVLVPGNHDHALIGGWLAQRSGPLELEQRCASVRRRRPLLHALYVLVAEYERLEAHAPARPILDLAAADRVHQLVVCDREQPRERRAPLRAVTRQGGERRGKRLRGQVSGELAVAGAPQEEGEHGVHAPPVEEPKRLRVAPARDKQRLISTVIVDAHNQYIVKAGNL